MEVGLEGVVERVVAAEDTAVALGSGDVEVLGTPAVIALLEEAAVKAVAGSLPEGRTTVGTQIAVDHLAPTPVGARVRATARLDAVDERTLRFSVTATDEGGEIARGEHVRAVVDRARFLEGAARRGG